MITAKPLNFSGAGSFYCTLGPFPPGTRIDGLHFVLSALSNNATIQVGLFASPPSTAGTFATGQLMTEPLLAAQLVHFELPLCRTVDNFRFLALQFDNLGVTDVVGHVAARFAMPAPLPLDDGPTVPILAQPPMPEPEPPGSLLGPRMPLLEKPKKKAGKPNSPFRGVKASEAFVMLVKRALDQWAQKDAPAAVNEGNSREIEEDERRAKNPK